MRKREISGARKSGGTAGNEKSGKSAVRGRVEIPLEMRKREISGARRSGGTAGKEKTRNQRCEEEWRYRWKRENEKSAVRGGVEVPLEMRKREISGTRKGGDTAGNEKSEKSAVRGGKCKKI